MRKVVALTAIAGVALASDFDVAADNNLAAGFIQLPRIQKHPLYLDTDLSGNERLEILHQRELILDHFPILNKQTTDSLGQKELILKNLPIVIKQADDANDELFADFADMEFRDRRPTFSIFDKKKVEKGEKCEHAEKNEDHELNVFVDFMRSQPRHVQKAILEAHPIFAETPSSKTQSDEHEVKNVQKRSNYSVLNKKETTKEDSSNQGRTAFTNFSSKREVNTQEVKNKLTVLYAKWLLEQESLQNNDELYGIKNIMKKDKDSWKGGVLSLDDEEDDELMTVSLSRIHKSASTLSRNYPKTVNDILGDAADAVRQVQERNKKPALKPISSLRI